MPGIDDAAVRALHDEVIDWRFKGMPAEAFGRTVGEFLAGRPRLSDAGFVGPLLVLDRPAMEHNLRTMADWCSRHGIRLAPHGKTTMAPRLFQHQLAHGAWGITAATASTSAIEVVTTPPGVRYGRGRSGSRNRSTTCESVSST